MSACRLIKTEFGKNLILFKSELSRIGLMISAVGPFYHLNYALYCMNIQFAWFDVMRFYPVCLNEPLVSLPLYADCVPAGFPSPAADYIDKPINLNELLIAHPASTYFVRVSGESMTGAGIFDGSLLLVDSSIRPQHNDIIIACLGGEFTVKRYVTRPKIMLLAENPGYPAIEFNEGEDLETFGVVKFVINEAR